MKGNCNICANGKLPVTSRTCVECGLSRKNFKKQTNADRIRAMTDEELAAFIAYSTSCETCVVRKGGSDECHNTNCSTAWLGWLKQEVTND
jgi:hypothetical protein